MEAGYETGDDEMLNNTVPPETKDGVEDEAEGRMNADEAANTASPPEPEARISLCDDKDDDDETIDDKLQGDINASTSDGAILMTGRSGDGVSDTNCEVTTGLMMVLDSKGELFTVVALLIPVGFRTALRMVDEANEEEVDEDSDKPGAFTLTVINSRSGGGNDKEASDRYEAKTARSGGAVEENTFCC